MPCSERARGLLASALCPAPPRLSPGGRASSGGRGRRAGDRRRCRSVWTRRGTRSSPASPSAWPARPGWWPPRTSPCGCCWPGPVAGDARGGRTADAGALTTVAATAVLGTGFSRPAGSPWPEPCWPWPSLLWPVLLSPSQAQGRRSRDGVPALRGHRGARRARRHAGRGGLDGLARPRGPGAVLAGARCSTASPCSASSPGRWTRGAGDHWLAGGALAVSAPGRGAAARRRQRAPVPVERGRPRVLRTRPSSCSCSSSPGTSSCCSPSWSGPGPATTCGAGRPCSPRDDGGGDPGGRRRARRRLARRRRGGAAVDRGGRVARGRRLGGRLGPGRRAARRARVRSRARR